MRTNDFAVTVVLKVAIVTTSIAGALATLIGLWLAFQTRRSTLYSTDTRPALGAGLAMVFGCVMWTSIVLSFLLYMSWRVRSGSAGAAYMEFSPPGGPSSGANARRRAATTGAYD